MSSTQEEESKQTILTELDNISTQSFLTEIYNAVTNKAEEKKQKINAINVAANGNLTYWNINPESPLTNPQQIIITLPEITTHRLEQGNFFVRVNLTNGNLEQIVINLLNIMINMGKLGYNIVNMDKDTTNNIRIFTLSKIRSTGIDNLID